LNAFTTTLVQTTFAFISACIAHFFGLYRIFFPTSTAIWVINSYFYWLSATAIHGIGAVLNISLLWLEIATFRDFSIITNIRRTRYVLIIIIASLYVWWLVLCLILGSYALAQLVLAVYMFFMIATVGIGAWKLSNGLASNPPTNSSSSEAWRHQAKIAEGKRIVANAKSICIFGATYFLLQVPYLVTYDLRIEWLSFWLGMSMEICFFIVGCTVLWHLKGKHFLSWEFPEQKQTESNPTPPVHIHIDEVECPSQAEFASTSSAEMLYTSVRIKPMKMSYYVASRVACSGSNDPQN